MTQKINEKVRVFELQSIDDKISKKVLSKRIGQLIIHKLRSDIKGTRNAKKLRSIAT